MTRRLLSSQQIVEQATEVRESDLSGYMTSSNDG